MKRGFTIVELAVVITVIATLSAVLIFAANKYQSRAIDGQGKSLAAAVKAGAERYYRMNNEYPLASALFNGTPNGSKPASYVTASNLLKVPTQMLDADRIKFVPCSGASCNFTDKTKVYYLTKTATDGTAVRSYVNAGCTYTLPATENGPTSFVILYYSIDTASWLSVRSNNGVVTSSDPVSLCVFTAP